MLDEAVAAARNAEVVVLVLGGSELTVREDRSRTSLDLPGHQQELMQAIHATGKPTVLVLLDGRAATINYANQYPPFCTHGSRENLPERLLRKHCSEIIIRADVWQ